MKKSKRSISKSKMYGFNPYLDQLDEINRIVAESGANEATVLRKLIDEALVARRRSVADKELGLAPPASSKPNPEYLQAIENLLSELVRRDIKSDRLHDVLLALAQETLAEARAGRKAVWEQASATLKERGLNRKAISDKFDEETISAKDWAYKTAKAIKQQNDDRARAKEAAKKSS